LYYLLKRKGLKCIISKTCVEIHNINTDEKYLDQKNRIGLINLDGAYYWLSLDSHNRIINIGIGEPRYETVIYQYQFDSTYKDFLESLIYIKKWWFCRFDENTKRSNNWFYTIVC